MEENVKEKTLEKKDILGKVKKQTEEVIENILNEGLRTDNVDLLCKIIDIHKDISNEEYWKEDIMRYRSYGRENYGNEYGNYGRENYGRGNYGRGNYGRRGVDAKYRGDELLDEMYQEYHEYNDGKEMYGADQKTMESFKYMVKAFKDYYKHLKQNASSQEEVQILDEAIDEMANM